MQTVIVSANSSSNANSPYFETTDFAKSFFYEFYSATYLSSDSIASAFIFAISRTWSTMNYLSEIILGLEITFLIKISRF